MEFVDILRIISRTGSLTEAHAEDFFENTLTNPDRDVSPVHVSAYLYSTALRPLSKEEFVGAAKVMRKRMVQIPLPEAIGKGPILDTCGTGGSGTNSFNTSTAVALITASAGVFTAKHGNRAASSPSGSADVLQALGLNITCSRDIVRRCLEECKFGFIFAPNYHPAAARVAPVRRELGVRTIFNFLGPVLNPAGANRQLIGVSDSHMQRIIAEALHELGTEHALVVRGNDGLDEISLASETLVYEVRPSGIRTYFLSPEDFGLKRCSASEISGALPETSAIKLREIFSGQEEGHLSQLVALNAGAALFVSGRVSDIGQGIELAMKIIKSGSVNQLINKVTEISHSEEA